MHLATTRTVPDAVSQILDHLVCPQCHAGLASTGDDSLVCGACGTSYPIVAGIADLRPVSHREKAELRAWSAHWSGDHQRGVSQRFFSFYRKAVFARAVRYFFDRYFPSTGLFLEAGSGTAETSMRIDRWRDSRTLVAVDIVLEVLLSCHPRMDVRVCGDIFGLPFRDASVDGIWNVGVMEHFTHHQIDLIMQEFGRVLRPGGRVILLWPGRTSIPQKMLRIVEWFINLRKRNERFQFHPDEISQLRSMREARDILARNGYHAVHLNHGFRSLMAFKILVGEKLLPRVESTDGRLIS